MIRTTLRCAMAGALLLGLGGCSLLDVSDPTAIEEADVTTGTGADLLRRGAVTKFSRALSDAMPRTGLLADEFSGWIPAGDDVGALLDRRMSLEYEQGLASTAGGGVYGLWQEARRAATLALPVLRATATSPGAAAHVGEMFAVRGFATLALAEGFCPGFPLHDIVDFEPVYGSPLSSALAFERALTDLDSAISLASDSARILNFARVGRARALVGLGKFAEAAATVESVPTEYKWRAEYNGFAQRNVLGFYSGPNTEKKLSVASSDGGNGLDFITANDPRVETTRMIRSSDTAYIVNKYSSLDDPIIVADGIEARLIEAEAALNGAGGDWIAMLNALRTTGNQTDGVYDAGTGGVAGLAPLDDPGTTEARVNLLFRERAFWLFGTNHRLGDLRRLISHYGRQSESVFSTGPYLGPESGAYGPATSIPFPAELETPYSPGVTGCTSR